MPNRTLGDLRGTLLARLGMAGMGASGGANQAIFDSFLTNGQYQLYLQQDWRALTDYKDVTLGVDQNLLDYPTVGTMKPGIGCTRNQRILKIQTIYSGQWRDLCEGIDTEMWNTMDTPSFPSNYERYAQLMIYPKADQPYTVRIWYIHDLLPFSTDEDRTTLDDELVFLHALANAKAHYRQPDAGTYQGQLNSMLEKLSGQSIGSNGVYRRGRVPTPMMKPQVVGRDE